MKRVQIDEKYFINICQTSANMSEACRALGLHPSTFRRIAKRLGCYEPRPLNVMHRRSRNQSSQDIIDVYLSNKVCIAPSALRRKLIEHGFKEPKCEVCGLSEWMGKPIPLELHHKDHNRYNNALDNLQILCPTCHSQMTDGNNAMHKQPAVIKEPAGYIYRDPVVKIEKAEDLNIVCAICGNTFRMRPSAPRAGKYCSYECAHKASMKYEATPEELLDMFRSEPNYTKVALKLGVSDNAVKKRCKKLGIYDKVNDMIQKEKVARGVRMRKRQLSEADK